METAEPLEDAEALEYDRLRRFLTRPGPRFGIALAIVRDPVVGRELRERLSVDIDGRVETVSFRHEDTGEDLIARMVAASEGADVLFVVGLERLLVDTAGRSRETPAIANLNQRRDRLPELLAVRVVIWLGREALASFHEQAWDLRQVMMTVAEFERVATVDAPGIDTNELSEYFHFLGEQEVEARAAALTKAAEQTKDLRTRAEMALSAARAYVAAVKFDEALELLQQAAKCFEQLGDTKQRVAALGQVADILFARGDLDEALRIHRDEELPVYESVGDTRARAVVLGKVADILFERGELDEAMRIRKDEELPVYEHLGDLHARAITLGKVADILVVRGDMEAALRILQQDTLLTYERLRQARQSQAQAVVLAKIADILYTRGQLDEALRLLRDDLLPTYERLGDTRWRAAALGKIADVLFARGELDEAVRIRLEEQLPMLERLGDVRSRAIALGKVGDILFARGELDEALRIYKEEELPVHEHLGDVRARSNTLGKIADILCARGQVEEAVRIYRDEVLPVYERIGNVRRLVNGRVNLAAILLQQ